MLDKLVLICYTIYSQPNTETEIKMTKQEIMKIFNLTEAEAEELMKIGEEKQAERWEWIEQNWIKE